MGRAEVGGVWTEGIPGREQHEQGSGRGKQPGALRKEKDFD